MYLQGHRGCWAEARGQSETGGALGTPSRRSKKTSAPPDSFRAPRCLTFCRHPFPCVLRDIAHIACVQYAVAQTRTRRPTWTSKTYPPSCKTRLANERRLRRFWLVPGRRATNCPTRSSGPFRAASNGRAPMTHAQASIPARMITARRSCNRREASVGLKDLPSPPQ